MPIQLTGPELEEFQKALKKAFNAQKLDEMLLYFLNINREEITLATNLDGRILDILIHIRAHDQLDRLLLAARAANPDNTALFQFAQKYNLAISTPSSQVLQRTILETNSALDVTQWREKLSVLETQVCRIEIKMGSKIIYGTGFLIGAAVIITNYHVMKEVIAGSIPPADVTAQFDYKKLTDGTANAGTTYKLAVEDWLVDHSPYSPVDEMNDPKPFDPPPDHLDYAILRLNDAPVTSSFGEGKGLAASARRWIAVSEPGAAFVPDSPVFIIQHPQGDPSKRGDALKLVLTTNGILPNGLNGNKTRIRYRTNTAQGSSGSPCFDENWNLIALHHSGDPNFETFHKPTYNQGIPIACILALLKERGKDEFE